MSGIDRDLSNDRENTVQVHCLLYYTQKIQMLKAK